MSESFNQLMAEHRRLVLLRALASRESGGESNDSILQTIANGVGVRSSRDQVRSALAWLEEQGLVALKTLDSGTYIVSIRQRGLDVAAGLLTVPGVQRPAPAN